MKPSALFLLVLPALSSASRQESSQHKNVSSLELAPKDRTPDHIPSNRTMLPPRLLLSSPRLRQKRQARPSTLFDGSPSLKWVTWSGHLPDGAFAIYNEYENRFDYVCKHDCDAGFYTPSKGRYCQYPFFNKEYKARQFEILVNKDNFEILEWKDGSYGSVPSHSVKTCSHEDLHVAKNKYGLGKVHVRHKAFFLPWLGYEYYYKYYQVLTFRKDVYSEQISDVRYNPSRGRVYKYPPESMFITTVVNNACDSVVKTPTVSMNTQTEKRWDYSSSTRVGFSTSFSGGVPIVASGNIEISGDVSFTVSRGKTETKAVSHSIPLQVTIPPNHYCKVGMAVQKYKATVSFTARLTRVYRDGRTRSTVVSGMYTGVDIAEAIGVVDRCEPVPNARPCPQRRA